MKIRFNVGSSGMTLVEVLMAVGLTSVVGLAIASMLMNANKGQNNIRIKSDFQSSVDLARLAILNASPDCQNALRVGDGPLKNYSGSKTPLDGIAAWKVDTTTSTPVIEKNKPYLGYQVQKIEIGDSIGKNIDNKK